MASSSLIDLVTHDWKQINLPSLRSELDENLLEFDKLSNDNKEERKEVAKQTKELKKCKKEEKLKKFGSVLKLYQKHIDHKDLECKFIAESFLKIYQILSEAPDPIDALQNGQIQILTLQKQLIDYKDTKTKLNNYENEFNHLKNQEITVKKLKEERKQIQQQQLNKINNELIKQQKNLEIQFNTKLNEKDIKYNECKLQLKQVQNQLIHLQQTLDQEQNNLLSQSLCNENNNEIEESTHNMLEEDLDRANITILRLTKERDELINDKYNDNHNDNNDEIILMQFEMNTLKKRLQQSKEINNELRDDYHKLKAINKEHEINRETLNANIEGMRAKLEELPNKKQYLLLKEKVSILQKEFLNDNDVDINISIDALFNTKLQSLHTQINELKLDLHSKNNELLQYKSDYNDIKRQYDEEKLLIRKLENDLSQKLKNEDCMMTINIDKEKEENSAFLIVCEQRDRFRMKLQQIEELKLRLESKLDRLSVDKEQLKQENVALYSKIKFLETYQSVKKNHTINTITNRRSIKSSDEIEMKYQDLYEQSMNPFFEFRKREKQNRINSLDCTEWIAFVVGSTVLSKRVFRLFGVFYAIALHLLIFFTILHEYRSHGVFDSHLPGVQIDIPQNVIIE